MTEVNAGPTGRKAVQGLPADLPVRNVPVRSVTGAERPLAELPAMDVAGRVSRVRERLGEAGCDVLLVSGRSNVRYLTGFTGSAGMVLVRAGDAVLVTDGRYGSQAERELAASGTEVQVAALWASEQLNFLGQLVKDVARVGVEAEHVSWAAERRWSGTWAKDLELVPTSGVVEKLREQKDPGEIARISAAAGVADKALAGVMGLLTGQPTEIEVAVALDGEMRRLGAESPAFETIVASGPNGAEPHHRPAARRTGPGDLITFDFGARVDGYCSDMTRTFAVDGAALAPELRRVWAVVLASQDAGLSAVRAGVAGVEVDRACREVVEAAGYGDLFVHRTGHGVGLDIHEPPWLGGPSTDILASGQVVTVEPGVYVPGLGGARTEDTVVVTEAGCEILTMTPKEIYARVEASANGPC
ncbi:MAG TPA: Xaa-Pro peptidase family protein [Acidimicrobiales bacterium]|nr:Xaa-Pro peptidase family protein [Acidimicrobiales bacterium]